VTELHSQVDAIQSRKDLADFVRTLQHDLRNHPDSWENISLDDYLEALAAWVDDMDGYYRNQGRPVPSQPSWKTLAEILLAAKLYE
jgi:hypothetical protein